MGIVFRSARPEDAPGLAGPLEELGYPSSPLALEARLGRLLREPDQAVFVAEEHAEIHGVIHVQEFLSLASEPVGLVAGLVVASRARRRGVGRALMACAEDWARARGLAWMRLRTRTRRSGAHAFYRALGYELVKEQLQFRKALPDGGPATAER